jgi:hypothetical protein
MVSAKKKLYSSYGGYPTDTIADLADLTRKYILSKGGDDDNIRWFPAYVDNQRLMERCTKWAAVCSNNILFI